MTINIVVLIHVFLLIVSLALVLMAALTWTRRRQAPHAGLLVLVMCAEAFYAFGYAQELVQSTLPGALFWLHVEYIGIPWIPALWVLLGRRQFGLPSRALLLSIIPIIVTLAEWANGIHGLYDRSITLVPRAPLWVVAVQRGPIAWLNLAFLYGSLFYGAALCIARVRSSSGLVRLRTIFFAASCVPPLIGYLIYFLGWSPWGLDLAPFSVLITVILVYVAVFRLEWFNLIPTARSLVFKSMRDAVLVIDLRRRLVDFNPAASALLPALSPSSLGQELAKVLPPDLPRIDVPGTAEGARRLTLPVANKPQHFEMRFFPLGWDDQQLGSAIILANITDQVELVQRLQHHAETDALTEVANRRAFDAALQRECARATRYHSPLTVMLIDVDHFKTINDRQGHAAGDQVLHLVARRIVNCLRSTDLLGRYGGDEFALLLPETPLEQAQDVAGRIRDEVEMAATSLRGSETPVTLSIGLSVHVPGKPADAQRLLHEADQALYSAKSGGRNRVSVWKGLNTSATLLH